MKLRLYSLICCLMLIASEAKAVEQGNYCYVPPSLVSGGGVPALVMFVMGRDHKFYYEAYNDASDLDGDGKLDVGYKHSIDYYGYFDPYKCYSYSGSGNNAKFTPTRKTTDKYCGGENEWSGNFLNWLSMSRMDLIRKVLYGGKRSTDSASETVLEGVYIPQDAHSWGKEYNGSDTRQLTPFSAPPSGKRHLFCVTSLNDGDPHIIRVLQNRSERIWQWASIERPVCGNKIDTNNDGTAENDVSQNITDHVVRVKVCDSGVGLEPNCKLYPSGGGIYKPIGLLQKYGEGDGSKWCSKSLKNCNTDSDCNPVSSHGLCIEKGRMYFGMLSGSFTKNLNGGVLRKNIWSIFDETNAQTGIFQSSENVEGNIILTLDRMKVVGFRYSDHSYQASDGGNCGWISSHPLAEGECRMWGNPIAEMMYETLRYFAGKGSPTGDFTYSGNQDSGLNLSKPSWGIQKGSNTYQPYDLFPWCAKPFMLVMSDINNSYDSDKVPGSAFASFSGDLQGLNVSNIANNISTNEGISGNWFIGATTSGTDFLCTPKEVSGFSTIRGVCPEEPTKEGSYYPAAVAYYGNTMFKDNNSNVKMNVSTHAVALASPVPDIAIKVGEKVVRIVPTGKSVSGCLGVYSNCAQKCTISTDSMGRVQITNCQSSAFCPTNQIVDFYVESVQYDSSNNLTSARFRINFEDVEQGADHDMDAIIKYEIQPVGSNQIKIKVTSEYAAGCIDQALGFTISGTTEDGTYLVVRDKDATKDGDTPDVVANLPLVWERTFTVSGTSSGQLKEPLWYAAKWGGFRDINGNKIPDLQSEWDQDSDGVPDTYFKVTNPLKLEEQLEKAFIEILNRVSSGTTTAVLPPSSVTESSLMVRTYFYPERNIGGTFLKWIGELSSLWFDYQSLIRENTDSSGENENLKIMDVKKDYPLSFVFSAPDNAYVAYIYNDLDNNGKPKSCSHNDKQLGDVKPVFSSGSLLAQKDPDTRNIKTWVDSNSNGVVDSGETFSFDPGNSTLRNILKNYWSYGDSLGTCDENCAQSVMKYIRGYDRPTPSGSSFRLRQENNTGSDIKTAWKLGDTIYSTPRIITNKAANGYDIRYNDTTYREFINEVIKNQKAIIVMGANDGMIHAFQLGKIEDILPPTQNNEGKQVVKITSSVTIGDEAWAFIPQNVLPYLRWYCQEDYCHIPMLETTFTVLDASIGGNPNEDKTKDSWRRLLIAQMGLGGTQITVGSKTFSSSIMVFDITDHLNPQLLWEKQLPDNTLTFATPGIVRLGDKDKNGSWYLVIGSGPTSITTNSITYPSSPKLYVFDLKTGQKSAEFNVPGVSNKAIGDFLSVDMDLPWGDYQVDDLYFGTYNDNDGELYRLRIREGNTYETSPSNWCPELIIDAGRPVFAAPAITHDHNGVRWLFFGTGIYLTGDHKVITNEKLFGIIERDNCWKNDSSSCNTSCTAINENSDLYNMTNTQFINAKAAEFNCNCPGGITISSGYCYADPQNPNQIICPACSDGTQIITKTRDAKLSGSPISSCNNLEEESAISCVEKSIYEYDPNTNNYSFHKLGWKRTLSQEKLYSSPVVIGGAVLATPFKPIDDPCSVGGDTRFIGVYYTTGTPYYQPIIRTEGGTTGTLTALIIGPEVEIGKGPPPTKESIVVKQNPQTGAISAYTQASGGVIKVEVGQPNPPKEMFIHWISK